MDSRGGIGVEGVPLLTLLMGTCNRREIVQRAIDAFSRDQDDRFHLVVIDAGSSDGTIEVLRLRQDISLIEDGKKIGQATSLNRVTNNITSPYLCWISDDNILQPGVLSRAVHILESDTSVGMVSLKTRDVNGSRITKPYIGAISSAGFINCNQGVIRRSLFKEVGGFDETLSDYMIDADLTAKVLLRGKAIVFTKDVAIEHLRDHESESWITQEKRKERLAQRRAMFETRYMGLISWVERTQTRRFLEKRLRYLSIQKKIQRALTYYGVSKYSWNERDWHNLAFASTVSLMDPFHSLFKTCYLRQSFPLSARKADALMEHGQTVKGLRREMHVRRWEIASKIELARKRGDKHLVMKFRAELDEIERSCSGRQSC